MENTEPVLSNCLTNYKPYFKTCFKKPENPKCIDLFITNGIMSFQNTTTVATGLFDLYIIVVTVCKTSFPKSKHKEITYKNLMKFAIDAFQGDRKLKLQSINNYESFESAFLSVLNKHTYLKKKFKKGNQAPCMTIQLRRAIMRRSELESILKIRPLIVKLNSKNKRIFAANFTKTNEKKSILIE